MRNTALLFTSAVLALLSTACSSFVPFTAELRSAHRLGDEEVKNLQFYSSHQITIRREVSSQDRQITPGHKLRLISGKSVEEVVIPAKTPGVATRVSASMISVSFVSGTSLDFIVGGSGARLGSADRPFRSLALLDDVAPARGALAAGFLGQTYAEPPGGRRQPVKIAGDGGGSSALDGLGGNYLLAVDSGQLQFAGLVWEAIDDTAQAHLLIDADKLEETEEKRTVLPGVRLGN